MIGTVHPKVTVERVARAVDRSRRTLDNPGFCIACGKSSNNCEPDARNYKCDHCGERQVFGAEELLMELV